MPHLFSVRRDKYDMRDRVASPPPLIMPSQIDLSKWLPDVRDQGQEGACTAFAGTGILAWHFNRFKNKPLIFSPQFLYRAERIIEGTIDSDNGAESRTMMKCLCTYGTCLEESDPYNDKGWQDSTSMKQLIEARSYKLGAYHRVLDLRTLKSVLASGYVASLAIEVYESFESDVASSGYIPLPAHNERLLGGHEVYTFGYDDRCTNLDGTVGALMCRNSWSKNWGMNGNFMLPYSYWLYVYDSWTAHFGTPWKPLPMAQQ